MNKTSESAPIRVAHLLDGFHFGGAEQIVRRLAEAAPRVGVEASVYCLREGRLATFLREEGVPVRVFGAAGRFDLRYFPRLLRAAREDRIQILQAHTSRTHLLARLASARLGIPNLTTIHSPIAQDENRALGAHPLRAWVERLGRPWTHHIVTVSAEERERLIREEGVAPGRVTWIPNGVDVDEAAPPDRSREDLEAWLRAAGAEPGAFVIAMIAQMRPRKGPEVLLQAFASWRKRGGRGVLLMIGDDEFAGRDYLRQLKVLADNLGVGGAVRFTGFMADPWRLARGADLLALPSLFGEGMPLVLLEAMSRAMALAVSDTPGNRELAAGGAHGWLHPAGDAETLAAQLNEAAATPALLQAKGQAARAYFLNHFTLNRVIEQYRAIYEKMMRKK